MPDNLKPVDIPVPAAGMNTEVPRSQLSPAEAVDLTNFVFRGEKEMAQRGATTLLSEAPVDKVEPDTMLYWPAANNLLISYSGDVWQYDLDADTWTQVHDWSASVDYVPMVDFGASGSNKVYLAPQDLYSWDGSSLTDETVSGEPSQPHGLAVRWDKLYVWGDPNHPGRIYASDVLKPTVFDSGAAWNTSVGAGEGAVIVDAVATGDAKMFIFTGGDAPAVWQLTGYSSESYALSTVHSGLQAVRGTAQPIKGDCLFLADDGVYQVGALADPSNLKERPVSASIQSQVEQLSGGANGAYVPEIGAYLICDGSSEVWVSNLAVGPHTWTRFDFSPWVSHVFARGKGTTYMAGGDEIWALNPYEHEDMTLRWITPSLAGGDRPAEKQLYGLNGPWADCGAGEVDMRYRTDKGMDVWGPWKPMTRENEGLKVPYQRIQFDFRFTDIQERVFIRKGFQLYATRGSQRLPTPAQ